MSEDLEIPDFAHSPLLRPLLSSSSRPANEDSHIRGVRHPVSSISNFPAPRDRGAEAPAPPRQAGKLQEGSSLSQRSQGP